MGDDGGGHAVTIPSIFIKEVDSEVLKDVLAESEVVLVASFY